MPPGSTTMSRRTTKRRLKRVVVRDLALLQFRPRLLTLTSIDREACHQAISQQGRRAGVHLHPRNQSMAQLLILAENRLMSRADGNRFLEHGYESVADECPLELVAMRARPRGLASS